MDMSPHLRSKPVINWSNFSYIPMSVENIAPWNILTGLNMRIATCKVNSVGKKDILLSFSVDLKLFGELSWVQILIYVTHTWDLPSVRV